MILLTMETMIEYLESNLRQRGWTQADLARKSGLDSSLVSNFFAGRRNVGAASAVSIARAFNVAPEIVFRKAGLLPNVPESTAEEEQLLYLFRQMTPGQRRDVLEYADFKSGK